MIDKKIRESQIKWLGHIQRKVTNALAIKKEWANLSWGNKKSQMKTKKNINRSREKKDMSIIKESVIDDFDYNKTKENIPYIWSKLFHIWSDIFHISDHIIFENKALLLMKNVIKFVS